MIYFFWILKPSWWVVRATYIVIIILVGFFKKYFTLGFWCRIFLFHQLYYSVFFKQDLVAEALISYNGIQETFGDVEFGKTTSYKKEIYMLGRIYQRVRLFFKNTWTNNIHLRHPRYCFYISDQIRTTKNTFFRFLKFKLELYWF